jgi:hypothetical protein
LKTPEELVAAMDHWVRPDLSLDPASPDIRCRHVIKRGQHFYILFNEGPETVMVKLTLAASGKTRWLDCHTGDAADTVLSQPVTFRPHELRVMAVLGEVSSQKSSQ